MKIRKEKSADAMIEFALIMPVFITMLLGVLQMGLALQKSGALADSARAGAESALLQTCSPSNGCYTNYTSMQSVATASAASAGITSYSAVATNFCTCNPGSGTTVSCTGYCTGYGQPAMYVQVTATGTVPVFFGPSSGFATKAVARVRIPCPLC
jgi:Flp pilus assembly protein TadG